MRAPSLCLALLFLFIHTASAGAQTPPPNVVVILADDMGFSDAGCYGGEIETPNLDRLAAGGLRYTQFYNTARCWPSRAALLTGYYAQQVRRDALPGVKSGSQGTRPQWARLLPEMLAPLGYRSYHSGKWHVDGQPLKNGFVRSYRLEDHNRFFTPQSHFEDDKPLPAIKPGTGFYVTTHIAEHAVKCLREHAREHANSPFFSFVAFTSPHFPLQALPEDIARYRARYQAGWDAVRADRYRKLREREILSAKLSERESRAIPYWNVKEAELQQKIGPGEVGYAIAWSELTDEQKAFQAEKMAIHAAMIDRMDQGIGLLLDQLKAMSALDNTIILFMSDNGASAEQIIRGDGHDPHAPLGSQATFLGLGPGWSTTANTPFRFHKSWVHEGGIATPLIAHWPAGIKARGELRHNPAHLIDVVPTILETAGGKTLESWEGHPVPPAPGKSLVPTFTKDGSVDHAELWWSHDNNRAIRQGDWKLVAAGKDGEWELFNLAIDRSETQNLAAGMPGKVQELESAFLARQEEFKKLVMAEAPDAGR